MSGNTDADARAASYDREDGIWYNVERGVSSDSNESDIIVKIKLSKDAESGEYIFERIVDINTDELADSISDLSFYAY